MSCCGKKRRRFHKRVPNRQALEATENTFPRPRPAAQTGVYFEYVGKTALTVLGPISRKRYRFGRPGARLEVDGRDAPALIAVPKLRRVKT